MRDKLHTLNNLLVPLVGYRDLLDQRLTDLISVEEREREIIVSDLRRLIGDICDAADRASLVVTELQKTWRAIEKSAPRAPAKRS